MSGADIGALTEEMDNKGIRYKVVYGKIEPDPDQPVMKTTATPSKSIFRREDDVVINVNGG